VTATVISVNVGLPREAAWAGIGRTSIDKQPVAGPVLARRLGLDGDRVSDTKHHGGVDQAVYAFAREDLDAWAAELGLEIRDGQFGENLTTTGIDVNEAEVGERWLIGDALLEVASVRIPCNDFKVWMGRSGYDERAWVRRFAAVGRPGPYLRVLTEGEIRPGDEITVTHRPGHGVTVSTMFRALTTDHTLLPELLRVDGMVVEARLRAKAYVAGRIGLTPTIVEGTHAPDLDASRGLPTGT
jgi:MOSC domain-containing protein YiiM